MALYTTIGRLPLRLLVVVVSGILVWTCQVRCVRAAAPENQTPRLITPPLDIEGYSNGAASGRVPVRTFVNIRGSRINFLRGIGIVTGLTMTGDNQMALFSIQHVLNVLRHEGVRLPPDLLTSPLMIMPFDMATVAVTAEMPSYARKGTRIDAHVAAMGNARSIQGGVLYMTPLKGTDGKVYAIAQGPVSVAGHFDSGSIGSMATTFLTAGIVPKGVTIERELEFGADGEKNAQPKPVELDLKEPDEVLARRIAAAVAVEVPGARLVSMSPGAVKFEPPKGMTREEFVTALDSVTVAPPAANRVVVNEKTGTIVIGGDVQIGPAAIAYGTYTVTIGQAGAAQGGGANQPNPQGNAPQGRRTRYVMMPAAASVAQLASIFNVMGVRPADSVAILEALDQAGVLYGRLEVK